MSVLWETATIVKNGVTYWLKDEKARALIKECYSPSNPPPTPSGLLPPGGTTGQVPKKRSNSDYDIEWADESGGGGATNTWYATCSTDAGVGGKTAVSATGDFSLVTGSMVRVLFSKANIALNPTLSVDGSTVKNIRPVSTASGMDYMWKAGEVVDLVYDGSNFVMTKGGKADTSFYGITKLSNSTNSSATDVAATSKAVKDVKDAIPAASSATPQDLGTPAAGSSSDYSRADHVHKMPNASDVGLGNVDNVQQYSASNPPPYPVTSVFGRTGDVSLLASDLVDLIYPVGSIYMSVNSTNPGTLFGGTWQQLKDRFLLAAGDTYTAGNTGGAETHHHSTANHTLTVSEIPSHTHGIKGWRYGHNQKYDNYSASYTQLSDAASSNTPILATGGGGAHNHGNTGDTSNMPPYLVVYVWERTA